MFLTETEAAQQLKIDRRTLRRLIEAGRLRALNVGSGRRRHYRIAQSDLTEVNSTQPALQQTSSPHRLVRRRVAMNAAALLPAA